MSQPGLLLQFDGSHHRWFGEFDSCLLAAIEDANEYLQNQYLPHQHNSRFSVLAHNPQSAYKPLAPLTDLESIFCVKECRIIGKDHTISLAGKKDMIADELKFSIHKQKIELRLDPKTGWQAFFAGRPIKLIKVQKQRPISCVHGHLSPRHRMPSSSPPADIRRARGEFRAMNCEARGLIANANQS